MKKLHSFIVILLATLALCSCVPAQKAADTDNPDFTTFTDELFCSEANSDSLTLNYTLSRPEDYGITSLPKGFSTFSYEDLASGGPACENMLAKLESYDKGSLSFQQQVLYDTLHDTLESEIRDGDYTAFSEALGPTTGIQAQLPVLLAEFRIEDADDLEQYFALLSTVPDYFAALVELEKKKAGLGTLPCQSTLRHIISQCDEFMRSDGAAMLSHTFEAKVSALTFLNDKEKESTAARGRTDIDRYVMTAYRSLTEGLRSLLGSAGKSGSLSAYPDGASYYAHLVRRTTGSSLSLEELEKRLKEKLDSSHNTLLDYAGKSPSLFTSCDRYVSNYPTPDSILDTLQTRMADDFPEAVESSYEIKYVDKALENYLSPAFYLTPPVDDSHTNTIYINNSSRYDASSLFNTLAHEGYPGHLYQTCYMHGNNLPPLRHMMDYGGYTEGWATYAEIYAYKYTGVSKDEVGILRNNMISALCLYGLCDIGVHAHGWGRDELSDFLGQYGSWGADAAASVYDAVVDEPASYLKYAVGYLEIMRLKDKVKEHLGSSYSEKAFHTYFLNMGPTSFDILERYIPSSDSVILSR